MLAAPVLHPIPRAPRAIWASRAAVREDVAGTDPTAVRGCPVPRSLGPTGQSSPSWKIPGPPFPSFCHFPLPWHGWAVLVYSPSRAGSHDRRGC